ncbi:beta-glucuronosyltransferase GlcAT14A-like isoform X2 [Cicer arietinum]|uniref:Beta-glucuronosyltransferase GlcAT14A-like isoform X2 n=1 Tax=Cicer arietinum TaxID=3827 RepID=A0A3Q7X5A2_CICAR|nr:beta-glucuronosyltransferase GlcAT14A-like isoform X2 [Cicer arietinum]
MGIKIFMFSFLITSILLFFLFIPTRLTLQTSTLNPSTTMDYFNVLRTNKTYPITFAYLISTSKGDVVKLKRLLKVLYHPGNYYLIHMDYGAPDSEHKDLAKYVANDPVFSQVGNVWIVGKPNLVTYRGPTMLATTLHAMAMLLRTCHWDWFINLSASDYPLVTQDDLIHAFSEVPRDINFIQHSSRLGWKLNKRGKPMIIDPGLYSLNKSEIWWVIKQRSLPTSFKLYTAWTIVSRSFAEYCIMGWENLPRTLLLYYTNFVSSPEGYFQTVICNSEVYKNTTANHDLHYITWDNPPKQHPRSLGLKDYRKMVLSSRPFARKFKRNDPVLDKIDRELLKRHKKGFSFGGWCYEGGKNKACSGLRTQNYGVLKPGPGSRRLQNLIKKILSDRFFHQMQCSD